MTAMTVLKDHKVFKVQQARRVQQAPTVKTALKVQQVQLAQQGPTEKTEKTEIQHTK